MIIDSMANIILIDLSLEWCAVSLPSGSYSQVGIMSKCCLSLPGALTGFFEGIRLSDA